jgi:hypothetical protein
MLQTVSQSVSQSVIAGVRIIPSFIFRDSRYGSAGVDNNCAKIGHFASLIFLHE